MFKKPATLKPASTLKSSARRAFITHLQSLYPALAHATPEQIAEVVPAGLKQCGATTSGGHKAVIYTDEKGKPLWFEVGHEAASALQQSQQQHKKQAHNGKGKANNVQSNLAEVIPTIYALWLMPTLLPRLPTWPQIVDPTLLGGSALMIPGLLPSPHTFPDDLQWREPAEQGDGTTEGDKDGSSSSGSSLPQKTSLVAITAYPSPVPLVIARLETDMKDIITKRASGEKGKAASTLHALGDHIWELGGKEDPPNDEEVQTRSAVVQQPPSDDAASNVEKGVESITLSDDKPADTAAAGQEDIKDEGVDNKQKPGTGENKFTVDEVDEILHLALLLSLKQIAKQPGTTLPMPTSALYSTYVLPNRSSQWPPLDAKGRKRARIAPSLVASAISDNGNDGKILEAESTDIRHCSAKKLAKWIKQEEKHGLFKTKDVKGKDTVITTINDSHADLRGLEAYLTIAQAQQQGATEADGSTTANGPNGVTNPSATTAPKAIIVIERFWRPSSSCVKLFQEMGCETSNPVSKPVIRKHVLQFIQEKELVDPRNQAMVRIEDPHLTHALYPKASLKDIPAALRREELLERLLSVSCIEFHRTSRLTPEHAAKVTQSNAKGDDASALENLELDKEKGEIVGQMTKGAAQLVKVEIKTRQGRKVISLITNVEVYAIDAEQFAADLMRIVGASASCSTLPGSTAKHPKHEIFVQGDQRKAIFDLLESQHGLDRKHVHIHDMTKK
ncbi:uncharacterized protein FA14DRAFT_180229 [Meira miltonrushii]|uniref:Uncharacterized protein n=1 Tax=Meira miltonrushii TaxID=1280837 RepID=A0A316V7W1_9BASI|nr:uncharacterized protein FA14DRAFT_180229 [Meira miltonrushii]PWN33590.1 hypothetical protein FA14DRAFT_180229 [Meira miltonrushii]